MNIPSNEGGFLGLKNIRAFQANPLVFLTKLRADYGDIVRFQFATQDIYFITKPEYLAEILEKQREKLVKWEALKSAFRRMAELNIVILEGEAWQETRSIASPAFHQERIQNTIAKIERHAQRLSSGWQDGAVYEMNSSLRQLVMAVVGEILFGVPNIETDAPEFAAALESLLQNFMADARTLIRPPDWIPTARKRQRLAAKAVIHATLMALIKEARQKDKGDVFSAFVQAGELSDEQAAQLVLSLFLAGRETPIRALTWTLYLLAKHPDIQEKLYQALKQNDNPPYLQQVFHESLRLYPPAWSLLFRKVIAPIQLGDKEIPVGAVVYISTYIQHHDPRYWHEPERFNPENFSEGWKERVPAFSYIPFSAGARSCLGSHLAETEIKTILSRLLREFLFELSEANQEIEAEARFTLHPKGDVLLRVRKRQTA